MTTNKAKSPKATKKAIPHQDGASKRASGTKKSGEQGKDIGKLCQKCKVPGSVFGPNFARKDGFQSYCRTCMKAFRIAKEYDKVRWQTHRDHESARSLAYRTANADTVRAVGREATARRRAENPAAIRANNIARKHGQARATPKWADLPAMNSLYKEAKRLREEDGIERHLDHVVPLKHKLVCGLHVPANLQILTATENMSKHNAFAIGP